MKQKQTQRYKDQTNLYQMGERWGKKQDKGVD